MRSMFFVIHLNKRKLRPVESSRVDSWRNNVRGPWDIIEPDSRNANVVIKILAEISTVQTKKMMA